jgi:hypothetical protein
MNVNEICQLLEKAKECGVTLLDMDEMKIHFGTFLPTSGTTSVYIPSIPSHTQANPIKEFKEGLRAEDILKPPSHLDQLSEEEILFAATPYFDELQAKKAGHQQKIDEEMKK